MKRKLALLLAVVMTLSLLPMNVFAASTNTLSKSPSVVPDGTLFYEQDIIGGPGTLYTRPSTITDAVGPEYYVDGTHLVIELRDSVKVGDTIRLQLENSKWFFRQFAHTPALGTTAHGIGLFAGTVDREQVYPRPRDDDYDPWEHPLNPDLATFDSAKGALSGVARVLLTLM